MSVPMKHQDLPAICELLVEKVATGPKEQPTLQFLFKKAIESLEDNKEPENIGDYDLAMEVWGDAGKTGAVRVLIGRLRKGLDDFYSENDGRKESIRVRIGPPGYALLFERNRVPPMAGDRVRELWAPYLKSNRPVRLLYSPPLFLQDGHQTNFHNSTINSENFEALAYLGITEKLTPTFEFIPAGIVQTISLFHKNFQDNDTPLVVGPLRSTMNAFPGDDEDVILIGGPPANQTIKLIESSLPIKSGLEGSSYSYTGEDGTDRHVTCTNEPTGDGIYTHWALFTRTKHRYKGRMTTLISGTHDRAIEAAASFMTRQDELKDLISYFQPRIYFEKYFQVLFKVHVAMLSGESHFDRIEVEHVVPAFQ
jgi:hypothetical protein